MSDRLLFLTRIHKERVGHRRGGGATTGWLLAQAQPDLTLDQIVPRQLMPQLQQALRKQGLRLSW